MAIKTFVAALAALLPLSAAVYAQNERNPATPLIAFDPYFSVWSMADHLTDQNTKHWTGTEMPMRGYLRVDGTSYRWMGRSPGSIAAMEQKALHVTPTQTEYTFEGGGVRLRAIFLSPSLPTDLDVLARPVTYLTWQVSAVDGKPHAVELYLGVDTRIAVDTSDQQVTWQRARVGGMDILTTGSVEQRALARAGDNLRADWGYFHLAVPAEAQVVTSLGADSAAQFLKSGSLPQDDDLDQPRAAGRAPQLAVEMKLQVSASQVAERHVGLAFTQPLAIEYLNRRLKPYWARDGKTPQAMLTQAMQEYASVMARSNDFDEKLTAKLVKDGGPVYARLATLAFRQTLAANGLAADLDGSPLQFPKENFSNGCIATVDVLYPSSPFFLYFNPALLEAQLKPVMEYAALSRWKFPFAPHDLGTYPLANGQVYGGGERTEDDQMPVEESGNMLLMIAAMGRAQGDWHFAKRYWPLLVKWAAYLKDKGLDPENQLSTDDFAGHLAHNANLSIKAIDALGAFAEMAKGVGDDKLAKEYAGVAAEMAKKWNDLAREGDHYKLAFDAANTWSQKYNLVWDDLLGLKLFPASVKNAELAFYKTKLNQYGLPLDSRRDYTKLDWELWTATLADDDATFHTLVDPLGKWLDETPTRVPLTDWYDTKTGKQEGFQARSVVGGIFIKSLRESGLGHK
ncbi:glutaminase family protein [Terriglobus albidus]|uniref:glutaminase family protein n=1 Tax=Terriglobus albidus TaxID=1592106 RepID=UPI0021DF7F4B|nr:glutaminase family protein [Terriglobus albidus]